MHECILLAYSLLVEEGLYFTALNAAHVLDKQSMEFTLVSTIRLEAA
jgi:hypothetical protein